MAMTNYREPEFHGSQFPSVNLPHLRDDQVKQIALDNLANTVLTQAKRCLTNGNRPEAAELLKAAAHVLGLAEAEVF